VEFYQTSARTKASFNWFVLEAEELAESLETYVAQSRRERHDSVQQDLIIDGFFF